MAPLPYLPEEPENERFQRAFQSHRTRKTLLIMKKISWPRIYDRSTTACWTTSTAIMASIPTEESTTAHPVKCLLNTGFICPLCGEPI